MHSNDSDPLKSNSDLVKMSERIERIAGSLKEEHWLPVGFRWVMARRLPQLKKLAGQGEPIERQKLARQVFALALASWTFGLSPLESQTVLELQALDLELSANSADEEKGTNASITSKFKSD